MFFGVLLGLFSGFIIENMLPVETRKFNHNYKRYTMSIVAVVALVCAFVTYPMTTLLLEALLPETTFDIVTLLPTSIFAMIGSGYATHHYLTRLRRYTLPPRKSKQVEEKVKRLEIPDEQISNSNHQHRHTLHSQQWRQHHDET
ncbi:MAG: hypothetical protein AAFV98_24610, partial [Chloroflexota bacterium]